MEAFLFWALEAFHHVPSEGRVTVAVVLQAPKLALCVLEGDKSHRDHLELRGVLLFPRLGHQSFLRSHGYAVKQIHDYYAACPPAFFFFFISKEAVEVKDKRNYIIRGVNDKFGYTQ